MANSHFREQPISLAEQIVVMKRYFPKFIVHWRRNIVCWIGEIQPGAISQRYRIKIVHQLHKVPQIFVLKPQLVATRDERVPHTYPGNRLCLYHPKKREWDQQMHIATTIVPWTSLWLTYYEFWQATGEWLGGGEHPELSRSSKKTMQIVASLR
ncbi:hypothetical protein [Leptothoe sp. PORK10 BA2]|uniref:hypothetical protein n=1 Tax=Leptothoe sp. PORK10 BA2 TaxID=3110254 RepID=UPI002B1FB0E3|nr:hypothetical protein [Leptothoe sp. PORK10 BA2]MEA5466361.1 hypothetical protein [Leptothoe sp. PORK10 BA2]